MENFEANRIPSIAFIGLGRMGYPMAGHLAKAGHHVTVYNRTLAKAREWAREYAGTVAHTPSEAAEGADIVMVCVSRDEDVREVVLGPAGVLSSLGKGCIVVDHSTGTVNMAKELDREASARGCFVLDAPVAGGEQAAINGSLSIMVGGRAEALAKVKPVLDIYAKSVVHMGDTGAGQITKMVNQVCLSGVAQGMAEALALAVQSGLEPGKTLDVLSGGAGRSFWLEYRGRSTVEGDYTPGFKADLMCKDLSIAMAEAWKLGLTLPNALNFLTETRELQRRGRGGDDITAIFDVIADSLANPGQAHSS